MASAMASFQHFGQQEGQRKGPPLPPVSPDCRGLFAPLAWVQSLPACLLNESALEITTHWVTFN